MGEKRDVTEANFAALRAKQAEARKKYILEKESKAVFAEAASAAKARGFGSNMFDETIFAECDATVKNPWFPPLPDWQKNAVVTQPGSTDFPTEEKPKHCDAKHCDAKHCDTKHCNEGGHVWGIDDLYKFVEEGGIKDEEEDEIEYQLPAWNNPGPAQTSSQQWCSQAMLEAIAHAGRECSPPSSPTMPTAVTEGEERMEQITHEDQEGQEETYTTSCLTADYPRFESISDLDIDGR